MMKNGIERLLLVAALLIIAVLAIQQCGKEASQNTEIKEVLVQREDSLQHWKDAAGREHGLRMMAIGNTETIKLLYQDKVDSITRLLQIKEKQLTGFTTAGTHSTGTVKAPVFRDTINGIHTLNYSDDWLTLSGKIGDSAIIQYSVRDSLTFTTYWKRKWLLGKKTHYIDAFSQNPRVVFTGLSGVQIKVQQPGRFAIGPYIGYGWNGQQWAPNIGIGLHYSLIRF